MAWCMGNWDLAPSTLAQWAGAGAMVLTVSKDELLRKEARLKGASTKKRAKKAK